MQQIFLKHGIPLPRRYRPPMTYQARLFLIIAACLVAFAIVCFAGLLITTALQESAPQYPDIISEQPILQK
jgi:hypothetical protein